MGFISDLLIEITSFRIRVGNKLNKLWGDIGNKATLTTTDKSNLVNAINEVNSNSSKRISTIINQGNNWYRIAKGTASGGHGCSFIIIVERSYGNTNNESYTFSVNTAYNGKTTITQLSGTSNARILTHLRVVNTIADGIHVDIKYNTTLSNTLFVRVLGSGEAIPATIAPEVTTGITELETTIGIRTTDDIFANKRVGSINGFEISGRTNNDIVLAGGGHRPVSDFALANDYLPLAGGTMTGDINFSTANTLGISKNGIKRLRFTTTETVLSSTVTGTTAGIVFRPQGDSESTSQVTINGNGQINTYYHGNSSQWKQAYDWGNYGVYGLGQTSINNNTYSSIDFTDLLVGGASAHPTSFVMANGSSGLGQPTGFAYSTGIHWNISSAVRMDLVISHYSNRMAFRSGGRDWSEVYHTGNFNPAQYVLQSALNTQLANYVPINGVTTINNTKTFTSSPIVPTATLNGHAVNLGQLNTILGDYATEDWVNQQGFVTSDTTYSGSASIILSGTSFQRAALTGDVTASQNSNTTTIANNAVTNPKMALMNANSIKGRAGSIGNPQDLTPAQVRSMLNVQEGSNRTRIGINGGNYSEVGDINLIAGSNVSLSKSGDNITINSTSQPIDTTVKLYMPGEVVNNDTVSCNASKTIIYLSSTFTGPLNIAIDPELQDGAWLIVIHTYQGSGPGLFNINGSLIDITAQLTSTYQASQGKRYRFIYVKDLGRFALVDGGGIYQ